LVVVPKGEFRMGSPEGEKDRDADEGPVRTVTIAQPFAVGRYEVTRGQFRAFVRATGHAQSGTPCKWDSPGIEQADDHPVVCVDWNDAQAYVAWLSKVTGRTYRLLSEAEWEYAARGVTSASAPHPRFHFGDSEGSLGTYAWFSGNSGSRTHPVGGKQPNGWGLYDMHGNVWEWVQDCYVDSYNGAPIGGAVRDGAATCTRVVRGGSWINPPRGLRATDRDGGAPDYRDTDLGFRVVRVCCQD
ncbi:MAG TPA: formylglycine-generating enzyme family protein, partial [Rhabdaerophilum sp.]|nr:formylglycine-generating enzyme family protein [Rhabdaerophilum sp.]